MKERKSGGPLEMKDSCLSEPKETDGLRLKKREEGKIPPERGRREMTVGGVGCLRRVGEMPHFISVPGGGPISRAG